jgi:glutathionyl-hydroquinone reductase
MYNITLNRRQIELLAEVLEQHSRIMCGHMTTSTITALDRALEQHTESFDEYICKRYDVENKLDELKKIIFPELGNGNYGVGHSDESDTCYEMYKMIRLQFDKERRGDEKYTPNVHSTPPLHHSKEPLIDVTQHK